HSGVQIAPPAAFFGKLMAEILKTDDVPNEFGTGFVLMNPVGIRLHVLSLIRELVEKGTASELSELLLNSVNEKIVTGALQVSGRVFVFAVRSDRRPAVDEIAKHAIGMHGQHAVLDPLQRDPTLGRNAGLAHRGEQFDHAGDFVADFLEAANRKCDFDFAAHSSSSSSSSSQSGLAMRSMPPTMSKSLGFMGAITSSMSGRNGNCT